VKSGFSVPGEETETVIGISIVRPRRFFLAGFFLFEGERSGATVGRPGSGFWEAFSDSSVTVADVSEADDFFAPSLTSLPQLHRAFFPANSGFRLRNTLPQLGQDTVSFKRSSSYWIGKNSIALFIIRPIAGKAIAENQLAGRLLCLFNGLLNGRNFSIELRGADV
jgi:hypothetical protein